MLRIKYNGAFAAAKLFYFTNQIDRHENLQNLPRFAVHPRLELRCFCSNYHVRYWHHQRQRYNFRLDGHDVRLNGFYLGFDGHHLGLNGHDLRL